MVNTRVNSQSSKKSSAIEKLSDYQRGKIPADKKKGTPATKQAKRDKKSKERWKNKATQRAFDINVRNKTIAEIRESRDKSRIKALERASEIELLRSQVKEERQNYIDEQLRHKENREQSLLREAKSLELYANFEKLVEVLREARVLILWFFLSEKITANLLYYRFFNFIKENGMTRTKEPPVGTIGLPNYKSPPSRILRSLRKGYDNVRTKVANKSQTIQSLQGKLRDTQESREDWKARAKDAEARATKLQQENEELQEGVKKRTKNH